MVQRLQGSNFLEGYVQSLPSFAGPLFSPNPQYSQALEDPSSLKSPPSHTIPGSYTAPTASNLPPILTLHPPPKPSGSAPEVYIIPQDVSPLDSNITTPTNIKPHRPALLKKAHAISERFLSKFCFGTQTIPNPVLPPPAQPTISHKDIAYHRDKTSNTT